MEHEASLVAQLVQNLLAMWEAQVQFLYQEDPLEKGNPPQYSGLKNSRGQRSLAGPQFNPWGRKESGTTERLSTQSEGDVPLLPT